MGQRFNPPPGWPVPPAGWVPPRGWKPDPAWGPAPAGWQYWVSGADDAPVPEVPAQPGPATRTVPVDESQQRRRRVLMPASVREPAPSALAYADDPSLIPRPTYQPTTVFQPVGHEVPPPYAPAYRPVVGTPAGPVATAPPVADPFAPPTMNPSTGRRRLVVVAAAASLLVVGLVVGALTWDGSPFALASAEADERAVLTAQQLALATDARRAGSYVGQLEVTADSSRSDEQNNRVSLVGETFTVALDVPEECEPPATSCVVSHDSFAVYLDDVFEDEVTWTATAEDGVVGTGELVWEEECVEVGGGVVGSYRTEMVVELAFGDVRGLGADARHTTVTVRYAEHATSDDVARGCVPSAYAAEGVLELRP